MRYIYITTNLVNGKRYIGQRKTPTSKTPDTDTYLGSGTRLLIAIKKYGKSQFKKEVIHVCKTQGEADELEILEIKNRNVLQNKDEWYNISPGGQFGRSELHQQITSKSMKEYYGNDKSYIKTQLVINRKRYLKGLKPTKWVSIAQRDIYLLRKKQLGIIKKRNSVIKKEIKVLIKKHTAKKQKTKEEIERFKKAMSINGKNAWVDRDSRIHMIKAGQDIYKQKRKQMGGSFFNKEHLLKLAIAKAKKSNNKVCLYLLENKIEYTKKQNKSISKFISKEYKREYDINNALINIKRLVDELNTKLFSIDIALKLINVTRLSRGLCSIT